MLSLILMHRAGLEYPLYDFNDSVYRSTPLIRLSKVGWYGLSRDYRWDKKLRLTYISVNLWKTLEPEEGGLHGWTVRWADERCEGVILTAIEFKKLCFPSCCLKAHPFFFLIGCGCVMVVQYRGATYSCVRGIFEVCVCRFVIHEIAVLSLFCR